MSILISFVAIFFLYFLLAINKVIHTYIHVVISKYLMLNFYQAYFLKENKYQNSVTGIKFYTLDNSAD